MYSHTVWPIPFYGKQLVVFDKHALQFLIIPLFFFRGNKHVIDSLDCISLDSELNCEQDLMNNLASHKNSKILTSPNVELVEEFFLDFASKILNSRF